MPKSRRRANGEGALVQRSDGRWQGSLTIGYDADGKQKRKVVYGRTQGETRGKLEQLKRDLHVGVSVDARLSVGGYFDQWLAFKRPSVKPRTHAYYESLFDRDVRPAIGHIRLAELDTPAIRSLLVAVHDRVSANAANRVRATMKALTAQAFNDGLLRRDPSRPIKRFNNPEPSNDVLWTAEETYRFLEVARNDRLSAAFHLALTTGMRHGEILGLRWSDLHDDAFTVSRAISTIKSGQVMVSTPKTDAGKRQVTLDAETLQVLAEHRARQASERSVLGEAWAVGAPHDDFVFTNTLGAHLSPRNFDRTWYRLLALADVRRIRFHGLRHFHVSLLSNAGASPREIADRIGHRDPAFTMKRYAHVFKNRRKEIARPLSELLAQA